MMSGGKFLIGLLALALAAGCANGDFDPNGPADPSSGEPVAPGGEGTPAANGDNGAVPDDYTPPAFNEDELPPEPENAGDETRDADDVITANELTASELAAIELSREAIQTGLTLGKASFADELNRMLTGEHVDFSYLGSEDLGIQYLEPRQEIVCPFLVTPEEQVAHAVDCRFLVDHARVASYGQITNIMAINPLDNRFDEARPEHEHWYEQGFLTGIENEGTLAARHIRDLGVCDQDVEPGRDSFEEGVEAGRRLYIQFLNERLAERGMNMSYPTDIRPMQVCSVDGSLLAPARSRAIDAIGDHTAQFPLCAGFAPDNPDQAARLGDAERRYQEGIERGIRSEHNLASESLFRVVPCNRGDPLVLDLAGDGVQIKPVTEGVNFDLFGWGEPVKMAWVGTNDAFLALDKNDNGRIDNGRELFVNFVGERGFDEVASGFDNLARYDEPAQGGNGDGRIDARDAVFGKLRAWQDQNQDGQTQAGELRTLAEIGVRGIESRYEDLGEAAYPTPHRAMFLRDVRGFLRSGKVTGAIYDAWFSYGMARQP